MKFEKFLESKGISSINESYTSVNEGVVESMTALLDTMKSWAAYGKGKMVLSSYKTKALEFQPTTIDNDILKKSGALTLAINKLDMQAKETKVPEQKEAIAKKVEALEKKRDYITGQKEVMMSQVDNEKSKWQNDWDDILADIKTDTLKTSLSREKSMIDGEAKVEALQLASKLSDKFEKDPARKTKKEEAVKKAQLEAKDKAEKFQDAEKEISDEDLETAEESQNPEINAALKEVQKATNDYVKARKELNSLESEAKADSAAHTNESEDFDFDTDLWEEVSVDSIFEKEEGMGGTPSAVLSTIGGINTKDKDGKEIEDAVKAKAEHYATLASLVPTLKSAYEAVGVSKTKLYDAVKKISPVTQTMAKMANAEFTPPSKEGEKVKVGEMEGKWSSEEVSKTLEKWEEVATEAKEKAGSSKSAEPAEKEPAEKEPAEKTEKEKLQDEINDLEQRLADTEKEENPDADELGALKDTIKSKKEELSKADESVEAPTSAPAPTKTIMKFADFLASRNN